MTQHRNTCPAPEDGDESLSRSVVPDSPAELLAMQPVARNIGEQKQERRSERLDLLTALIFEHHLCAWEKQQLTLSLLRHLQKFQDAVLRELSDDPMAAHAPIIHWAIDTDRLSRALQLLEDVDLD